MNRVIITGADGFVGSSTIDYFLSQGIEVLGIDILEKPKRLNEHALLSYLSLDLSNIDTLINKIKHNYYDTFIHFAWEGSSGLGRADYHLQMKNAITTVKCMNASKNLGCSRFVCAGSIMEKEVIAATFQQGIRPNQSYLYGLGKLTAHSLCKALASSLEIDLVWAVITNAYGVGEHSPRFVNSTLRKIIEHQPLVFTSGLQNYDFVYITDVARAFYLISLHGKPYFEYIIGSSNAKPLREFIIEITDGIFPNSIPQFGNVEFSGVSLPLEVFDTSTTEKDTGFKAEISFIEGIRKTMEWLKQNK